LLLVVEVAVLVERQILLQLQAVAHMAVVAAAEPAEHLLVMLR
jgi:hypothetical protein